MRAGARNAFEAFLCGVLLLVIALWLYWHYRQIQFKRQRNYVTVTTMNDLRVLATHIELEAITMSNALGTGVVADATSMPLLDLSGAPQTDNHSHPYHVKLSSMRGPSPGRDGDPVYRYELIIWSDGMNRLNEYGKGDDIALTNIIECLAQ